MQIINANVENRKETRGPKEGRRTVAATTQAQHQCSGARARFSTQSATSFEHCTAAVEESAAQVETTADPTATETATVFVRG
jgi:hypothetical protein